MKRSRKDVVGELGADSLRRQQGVHGLFSQAATTLTSLYQFACSNHSRGFLEGQRAQLERQLAWLTQQYSGVAAPDAVAVAFLNHLQCELQEVAAALSALEAEGDGGQVGAETPTGHRSLGRQSGGLSKRSGTSHPRDRRMS